MMQSSFQHLTFLKLTLNLISIDSDEILALRYLSYLGNISVI